MQWCPLFFLMSFINLGSRLKEYFSDHVFPAPSTIWYYKIWVLLKDHLTRLGAVSPDGYCIQVPDHFVRVWRSHHVMAHEYTPSLWCDITPACEVFPSWSIDPDHGLNMSSMRSRFS